jgi:hypothetical protein
MTGILISRIIAAAGCFCTAFPAALAAPGGTVVTCLCPPRKGVDADDHATTRTGKFLHLRYVSLLHGDVPDEWLAGFIEHVWAEAAR